MCSDCTHSAVGCGNLINRHGRSFAVDAPKKELCHAASDTIFSPSTCCIEHGATVNAVLHILPRLAWLLIHSVLLCAGSHHTTRDAQEPALSVLQDYGSFNAYLPVSMWTLV